MAFNNNLIFGIEDFDTKDKISNRQNQNIAITNCITNISKNDYKY